MSPSFRDETYKNPTLGHVRANFSLLDPRYGKIPLRSGDSAYTENKEIITLCLEDPDTKQKYDLNTLMYVSLHELAHVITPEGADEKDEHGPVFTQNFSNLLRKAAQKGIYNPKVPIPATYCKVKTS